MQARTPPIDRKQMQDMNQNTLLNLIRQHAPISRPQLVSLSGLSPATVVSLTNKLIERGFVQESGVAESTGGRKAALLEICPEAGIAVGLAVRGFETTGVLVNLHGDILFAEHKEMTLRHEQARGIELLADFVIELLTHANCSTAQVIGVGCALSGYIDAQGGHCVDSWNLDWHHVEISRPLSQRLSLPVFIDNDVSCLTTYEKLFGRCKDSQNFFTVSLGRGVGLGLVINGNVYRGATGGAGEFGHTVAVAGGRRCECGKRGCLEEYVSYRGIIANYQEHRDSCPFAITATNMQLDWAMQREEEMILELLKRADQGDEAARFAFQQSGERLGIGLANLVNVLNPEYILLTGEGTITERHMLAPMEAMLRQHIFSELGLSLRILIDPLMSYENWARGAAALVLHRFFASPTLPLHAQA
jgi:predicted NBD/HSP70 family sugar kinase